FLAPSGRFRARVEGPLNGNVLLRRAQFRAADDGATSARLARSFVAGKLANSRVVLQRALRDKPEREGAQEIESVIDRLGHLGRTVVSTGPLDAIRGIEGEAAARYFGVFDYLILVQRETFGLRQRTRRPARDPINSLLSFGYAVLLADCAAALAVSGSIQRSATCMRIDQDAYPWRLI